MPHMKGLYSRHVQMLRKHRPTTFPSSTSANSWHPSPHVISQPMLPKRPGTANIPVVVVLTQPHRYISSPRRLNMIKHDPDGSNTSANNHEEAIEKKRYTSWTKSHHSPENLLRKTHKAECVCTRGIHVTACSRNQWEPHANNNTMQCVISKLFESKRNTWAKKEEKWKEGGGVLDEGAAVVLPGEVGLGSVPHLATNKWSLEKYKVRVETGNHGWGKYHHGENIAIRTI